MLSQACSLRLDRLSRFGELGVHLQKKNGMKRDGLDFHTRMYLRIREPRYVYVYTSDGNTFSHLILKLFLLLSMCVRQCDILRSL